MQITIGFPTVESGGLEMT